MKKIYQDLSKFNLPDNFRGKSGLIVQLWWIVQDTIFRFSPQFMYGWRIFLLRLFGAKIGQNVIIRPTAKFTYPWKIKIGDNSWIGDDVVLYSLGEINIGKNCVISQKSYLCTGSHDYTKIAFDIFQKTITIDDEAWIATDVFVAPGVRINKGCVIAARSSVYADMPEGMICLGNPARPHKRRI